MDVKARPFGLTALAILNFFFGAAFAGGLTGYLTRLTYIPTTTPHQSLTEAQMRQGEAIMQLGIAWYALLAVCIGVTAALLFISGAGYLKLQQSLGRTMGNLAVLCSIAVGIPAAFWLPRILDGGLTGFTAINFTYPLLTLFLLNVTFKKYFVK